jgi:hypothetical protein
MVSMSISVSVKCCGAMWRATEIITPIQCRVFRTVFKLIDGSSVKAVDTAESY